MMLAAKLVVTCPKWEKTVDVKTDCVNCKNYGHVSYRGLTPLVSCTYIKPEPKPTPKPEEKKGLTGLQKW